MFFSHQMRSLVDAMLVAEPKELLATPDTHATGMARWAIVQAFLGRFLAFESEIVVGAEERNFSEALAFAHSSVADHFFDRIIEVARNLCPLEALAHLPEESRLRLASAQQELSNLRKESLAAFVGDLHGNCDLRLLAGIALSQESWLRDIDFGSLSHEERADVLAESPAFSWNAYRGMSS